LVDQLDLVNTYVGSRRFRVACCHMSRGLAEYRRKRRFDESPEPRGDVDGAGPAGEGGRFVVHEHHARRLHWDLRLERDGVLVSWAIPNGIPDDPKRNRKAVHVEDHPLEYLDFKGTIPSGYGAGEVMIWDSGTYTAEKWLPRRVIVAFDGEKLNGRYALFHAGRSEKDWMIHRMDSPVDATAEEMPDNVSPMLAHRSTMPPDEDAWGFEVKWDGVRAVAHSQPGRLKLVTRDGNDVTAAYPELRPLNRALSSHSAILDGEIVAFDEQGKPSFQALQPRIHLRGETAVRRQAAENPVTYVIFDLLWLDGHSLMELPYSERRGRLADLRLDGKRWRVPSHHAGHGSALLAATREQGLEGVIAKRLDSRYAPGRRDGGWLKIDHAQGGKRAEPSARSPARRVRGGVELEVEARIVRLSNPDKVLYPKTGFTKRDLVDYVIAIAPVLLPHLHDHPLTLKRYPDGVEGKHFYEKQSPRHRPDWVQTVSVYSRHSRRDIEYTLCQDLPTLVWLANLADIELHPSLSKADEIERPATLAFDLDPGPPATIVECCEVALALRDMFEQLGLRAFPKTSGSKGMQIYVPLNDPRARYEQTKPFAHAVAALFEQQRPELVVSDMRRKGGEREGKVLIDWSQNDEHKTTIAVYSLRARERPTVSTPLAWAEVEACLRRHDPDLLRFEHDAVLRRVAERGDLFAEVLTLRQRLPALRRP
jgi:bifunctional non-homologous end joining protein LigD